MPEKTTTSKPPATKATPPAEPKKSGETLKVAYTLNEDLKTFNDVVIFGTDEARTEFLRANATTWWRIADLAKGQPLLAVAGGRA